MGAMAGFGFDLHHVDAACGARRSTFHTPHGAVEMPAFMPVGTQGTVKGLEIGLVRGTGSQMVLANTYHLALRPGEEVVEALGGLHGFMGWEGPILTDSGGFQLFSLAKMTKVTEEGAVFRSHVDGRLLELSPERAVRIQESLGADVAMVLDHVVALPNEPEVVREASERTVRWAGRCREAARRDDQALFAIVQGGTDPDLRLACARRLVAMDFVGYAVGGLSVGETPGDVPYAGGDRARLAGGSASVPDGGGAAGGPLGGDPPGDRPVRLRDSHAKRAERDGVHRSGDSAVAEPVSRAGRIPP
jgi:queuine tRNA-ribosyltransferase